MAVSGSIDFNVTANEIITAAIGKVSARSSEIPLTDNEMSDGLAALNRMVKAWQTQGLHLWKRDEGVLFLRNGVNEYSIGGSSADQACFESDFINTTLTTAASSGASTITVSSTTGMAAADKIGIKLDDGTRQWTTITTVDSSTGLTLDDTLTGDTASGNTVFTYTTDIERPLKVDQCRRRLMTNTSEVKLLKWPREKYFAQTNKTSTGTPTAFYYSPRLTNGAFYIWQTASDVDQVLFFSFQRSIFDFDTTSDNPDFPVEWSDALIYNLAVKIAPDYDCPDNKWDRLKIEAKELLDECLGWDEENTYIQFKPK